MILTSDLESWLDRNGKSASSWDISPFCNSPFSKTTDLVSSIRFWGDAVIVLHFPCLTNSRFVAWIRILIGRKFGGFLKILLFSRFSNSKFSETTGLNSSSTVSINNFFQHEFFSRKSVVVCSVSLVMIVLTETVVVPLRLLLRIGHQSAQCFWRT